MTGSAEVLKLLHKSNPSFITTHQMRKDAVLRAEAANNLNIDKQERRPGIFSTDNGQAQKKKPNSIRVENSMKPTHVKAKSAKRGGGGMRTIV